MVKIHQRAKFQAISSMRSLGNTRKPQIWPVSLSPTDQRTYVQVKRGYFRLRTDGLTDGQPENIMPPAPKGGGIKKRLFQWHATEGEFTVNAEGINPSNFGIAHLKVQPHHMWANELKPTYQISQNHISTKLAKFTTFIFICSRHSPCLFNICHHLLWMKIHRNLMALHYKNTGRFNKFTNMPYWRCADSIIQYINIPQIMSFIINKSKHYIN